MSGVQLPAQLEAAAGLPIAKLSPELHDLKTHVVRGIVTITWPYSIIHKTIAFLLAEPDFRLRRAKGQVRVEFSGSSAKAVANAGLGSGDEIVLSLDGAELAADDSKTRVPGTSLEWQLKFKDRVLLQAKISDSEEVKLIDIDHPTQPEPAPELVVESIFDTFNEPQKTPERIATPVRVISSKRAAEKSPDLDEYASPAFLKRARVSYGSLFEGSLDIFDEDVGVKARAKKRAKTGRYSGVWRYTSRSPSPEPQPHTDDEPDDTSMVDEQPAPATPTRPIMVDGACQTAEQDISIPRDVQVAAEARHDPAQYWQTPSKSTMVDSGVQPDIPGVPQSPSVGMIADLTGGFVENVPIPIFTSAHGNYTPAFQQPPLGPLFGHDLHQAGMEPHYGAEGSFHEHPDAYPESGLDDSLDVHTHYPSPYLEEPHFGSQDAVTSQAVSETTPADQNHHLQQHDLVVESQHHAAIVDAVAGQQQVPWGLTSAHYSRPPLEPTEPAVSDFEGQEAPAAVESSTQAVPSDDWVGHHKHQVVGSHEVPEAEQALRVEDDQQSEDRNGPEEDFTSRKYAERHLEPTRGENEEAQVALEQDESSDTSSSESSSEVGDEEAEHEADDVGGDYDITNYRNLSNNQDDDDGTDLESDYGQEDEEEILDPSSQGDENDELEEDGENYGEEYDEEEEYDEYEDQENQPPAAAPRGEAPEVISLLSDSEDEENEAPPPRPAPAVQLRGVQQYDGSADEMEEDDMYDEEGSEGEHIGREGSQQNSSSGSCSEESEDDMESDGGTPTPKPRQANFGISSDRAIVDTADLTSATIGENLETMSPIKLPQTMSLSRGSSPLASQGDSDILEAELEKELEEEIAAGTVKQSPSQSAKPAEVDIQTEDVQASRSDSQGAGDAEFRHQTPDRSALGATDATAEVPQPLWPKDQTIGGADGKEQTSDRTEVLMEEVDAIQTDYQTTSITNIEQKEPGGFGIKLAETVQVQTEEIQTRQANDQDMITAGPEHQTEEVGIATPEATVAEVNVDATYRGFAEPMDVDMADVEETSVELATSGPDENLTINVDDMTEEQLIQTQLEEESMMEFQEQTIVTTISTTETIEERPLPEKEATLANCAEARPETETTETLKVTVETTTTEPLPAEREKQAIRQGGSEDAVDIHESDDTKPIEMASPPPTQQFHSQSVGEARLTKTQVSEASEDLSMEDGMQLVQLPTPGDTQNTESVFSQSFVENQLTELDSTEAAVPQIDDEELAGVEPSSSKPEKPEKPRNLENLASPTVGPVKSQETLEDLNQPSNQQDADATSPINDELSQIRDSSAQPSEAQSSLIAEEGSEEAIAPQPTPKRGRGHRRNRSDTNKDIDPSVKLARASIASRRSTRLSDRTTPDSTRVARARSHSLALKSDSPDVDDDTGVQLARAAIKSPSRAAKEPKEGGGAEQTPGVLKTQLTKSLRTDIPDCISLKALRNHPGKAVDVLAIATTEPPEAKRAKGGPRGIMLAFNVTDHSVAPTQTVAVQIFRPHKAALPVVHPGDAILLRHFSVMSLTGRGFGLRANDGSSWAVFERESLDDLPQIRGPPVELTEGETSYAALLKQWYAGLDAKAMAKLDKANEAAPAVEASKEDAK
ncbi:hypothetical protein EsH8_III_000512 [Colletotrichum jinshuiense]